MAKMNQDGKASQGSGAGTNPGDNRSNTDRDGNRSAANQGIKGKGAGNASVGHDETVIDRDRGDGRRTDKKTRRP